MMWLIAMSWLVVVKILPPLDDGLPPNYLGLRGGTKTCWKIFWNEEHVGWAASKVNEGFAGAKEIHGRVMLQDIPLADFAPSIISSLVEKLGTTKLDAKSRIQLDSMGHLSGFESRLAVNSLPIIRMTGRVENQHLRLRVRAGEFTHTQQRYLPDAARLGMELTPDGRLPGMYVGRKWKSRVFTSFRPDEPMARIEAEVVGDAMIHYQGQPTQTRKIEYRRMGTAGVSAENNLRAVVWVAEDGTVLRQVLSGVAAKVRF